jgi:hypothetical protein
VRCLASVQRDERENEESTNLQVLKPFEEAEVDHGLTLQLAWPSRLQLNVLVVPQLSDPPPPQLRTIQQAGATHPYTRDLLEQHGQARHRITVGDGLGRLR